ncbi:MAG: formimidoylglutamase [Saprospiraceae bacterium]|nr:formimidoylglutamase [Saprospiraceae bacterium]
MMNSTYYQSGETPQWSGRIDTERDVRLHQQVSLLDLNESKAPKETATLLGFCCEEGVRRNKGRVGAADGPNALRKALGNFAWHFPSSFRLIDAGNVYCQDGNLEAAQETLAIGVVQILAGAGFPVILGGGHETAWGSYLGIRQLIGPKANLGIINIDAHFDLRTPNQQANSGTPFRQMADWAKKHDSNFSYLCLGINPTGNTSSLFAVADDLGVEYLTTDALSSLPQNSLPEQLQLFVQAHDYLYLSIDLDAFDAAFAPGVSAPASLGLYPLQVLPWLQYLAASGKLILCDVCELNPSFDMDQRTAKLGASLLYRILQNLVFVAPI